MRFTAFLDWNSHNLLFSRWAGVSETRGDYPFSHHKLTVQFYEPSAAQDRKLEGLIHKAILELWRPKPTELTLFLTKGVDSTSIKIPPTAYPLTGSSDPCYIEAYHLADTNDGRVTLHLKVGIYSSVSSCSYLNTVLVGKVLASQYLLILYVTFQIINLTELELNRVDIRVGLSGALYFMDGSPQAVRQLRNLVSQVAFQSSILIYSHLFTVL